MTRVRQQNLPKTEQLTPAARVVDTFVQPEDNNAAFVKAQKLNEALGDFSGSVSRFMDVKHGVYTDDQVIQGQAKSAQSKLDFREAIAQGVVPAGASPWYKQGYEREHGQQLANEYTKTNTAAYLKWADKENATPTMYSAWQAEQRKTFMENNVQGSNVLVGFMAGAKASDQKISAMHNQALVTKLQADRFRVTYSNHLTDIQAFKAGELDKEGLVDRLTSRSKQFYEDGEVGENVRSALVSAYTQAALDSLDVDLIDQMLELDISGRGALGTVADIKRDAEVLRRTIQSRVVQKETALAKAEAAADEQLADEFKYEAWEYFTDNPDKDELSDELKIKFNSAMVVDPKVAAAVESFLKIRDTQDTREDPDFISALEIKAREGDLSNQQALALVGKGINAPATMKNILFLIQDQKKYTEALANRTETKAKSVTSLNLAAKKDLRSQTGKIYGTNLAMEDFLNNQTKTIVTELSGNPMNFFPATIKESDAKSSFVEEFRSWYVQPANANATNSEIRDKAREIRDNILKEAKKTKDTNIIQESRSRQQRFTAHYETKKELTDDFAAAQLGVDNKLTKLLLQLGIVESNEVTEFYNNQFQLAQ